MEQVIMYFVNLVVGLADSHHWLAITLMCLGGLYVLLTALRGFLTGLVAITKTDKDNKIVLAVYAFLDKFAYGFGKLAEYYENHTKKAE